MSIFDTVINRRQTDSFKWDMMEKIYAIPNASDILPMWVADMDFAAPEIVIDALQQRLNYPVFGYSFVGDDAKMAVQHWLHRRHNWNIPIESMLFHQGVVPAIASIVETFTHANDKVAISSPIYPPFTYVPTSLQRDIIKVPLTENNGSYDMDFVAFEEALSQGVKLYILCNPHNPAGVVWSESDLQEIIRLCAKYDVLILSDEIHADLVFAPHRHIPIANIAKDEEHRIITCVAPTKTFNLAGIQCSVIIVSDAKKRLALEKNAKAHGQLPLNAFAATALQAAYTHGDDWLQQLLDYLKANMEFVLEQLNAIEGIHIAMPQGTYLLWIDYRGTGFTEAEMMERLLHHGKLALEPGSKYGEEGHGFLRMNVACPRVTVEEGVRRFKLALNID